MRIEIAAVIHRYQNIREEAASGKQAVKDCVPNPTSRSTLVLLIRARYPVAVILPLVHQSNSSCAPPADADTGFFSSG